MRFGAIDIGSNAARLLVKDVRQKDGVIFEQKISFIRVPIRLGEDVFETGRISEEKEVNLLKTLKGFRYLLEAQGIEWFRACATSSVREAKNGADIVGRIEREAGIRLERISGQEEADIIFQNFRSTLFEEISDALYIDVGGGSTELTLLRDGKKIRSKSFQLGTVRMLKGGVPDGEWDAVKSFVEHVRNPKSPIIAVGTGGNINRYHRLSRLDRHAPLSIDMLKDWHQLISDCPLQSRLRTFGLKPDRADVIVPAGEVYIRAMELAGCSEILVPKVGLSDGMILGLWEAYQADQDARKSISQG
jgi:exopolyphosphatase/guanosine-5'-triphosphate,3'-diphosphate pyrophosphatase